MRLGRSRAQPEWGAGPRPAAPSQAALLICAILLTTCSKPTSTTEEIRIPRGAGGVGFLPLLVMEKFNLVEKHAKEAGADVKVTWIELGGPSVMNDALLAGSVDFIAAGPPAFLTLWDKTTTSAKVTGVAAMTSLPMYLNTRAPHLKKLDDVTPQDKIAMTAIKVSIPAIVMQMYAREKYGADQVTRFDKYTVSMTHPDGVVALLGGSNAITAHFTSPPFHQRERKDAQIRTIMNSDDVMGGSTTFTMLSTTAKYRQDHAAAYGAVLKALGDANRRIAEDKKMAADLLLASASGGGFSAAELTEILNDPAIKFTTTPENVLKYADFMNSIGSLKNRPASWKELFFPEIQSAQGS
jgi:NitT/TauT family transport system substrate-binding protein